MKKMVIVLIVLVLVCAFSIAFLAIDNEGNVNTEYWIIISCAGGAIAAIITAIVILYSYSRSTRSVLYPLEKYASMDLTDVDDIFISRTVSKIKLSSDKKR